MIYEKLLEEKKFVLERKNKNLVVMVVVVTVTGEKMRLPGGRAMAK
jgi:hypothetical protein